MGSRRFFRPATQRSWAGPWQVGQWRLRQELYRGTSASTVGSGRDGRRGRRCGSVRDRRERAFAHATGDGFVELPPWARKMAAISRRGAAGVCAHARAGMLARWREVPRKRWLRGSRPRSRRAESGSRRSGGGCWRGCCGWGGAGGPTSLTRRSAGLKAVGGERAGAAQVLLAGHLGNAAQEQISFHSVTQFSHGTPPLCFRPPSIGGGMEVRR